MGWAAGPQSASFPVSSQSFPVKCSHFGVPASQRFAEFLEVWFLNECVKREAGDTVWVENWTQIVGILFGSQVPSDFPDSCGKTIFSAIDDGLKTPYDSVCIKVILPAYLHRYFIKKFNTALSNEISIMVFFTYCKNSNRKDLFEP